MLNAKTYIWFCPGPLSDQIVQALALRFDCNIEEGHQFHSVNHWYALPIQMLNTKIYIWFCPGPLSDQIVQASALSFECNVEEGR